MTPQDQADPARDELDPALRCGAGPIARYRYLLRQLLAWARRRGR